MENLRFLNDDGAFTLRNPENISYLYFPLASETGLKSAVAPNLGGDCKQHPEFLVCDGKGLLVSRGGIRRAGGSPLYAGAGQEQPDSGLHVAGCQAGDKALWPLRGDHILCPSS